MSAPRLGGALNVHGSSGFAGGHSFAGNSVGFHGGNFGGGFHGSSFGVHGGYGWHGGWGGGWGHGWHGGWGGCWGCGFGWGWGPGWGFGWGWGGFWGPSWGWGPYYGLGYYPWGWPGYYDYPGYSVGYGDSGNYSSSDNGPVDNNSGNYNAGPVQPDNSGGIAEPQGSPDDNPVTGNVSSSRPTVLLYLKDGTTYAASDYWLQDGVLHYTVNYGGEDTLNMDELDLQRTVNENARRGINFSLHPSPSTTNPQPSSNGYQSGGSSTDQSNRYHAPPYGNGNSAAPAATPTPAPPAPKLTQAASQTL
jgi:hypothetical protein